GDDADRAGAGRRGTADDRAARVAEAERARAARHHALHVHALRAAGRAVAGDVGGARGDVALPAGHLARRAELVAGGRPGDLRARDVHGGGVARVDAGKRAGVVGGGDDGEVERQRAVVELGDEVAAADARARLVAHRAIVGVVAAVRGGHDDRLVA